MQRSAHRIKQDAFRSKYRAQLLKRSKNRQGFLGPPRVGSAKRLKGKVD